FGGLERLSLAQLLREVDRHFTGRDYTLRDLFLDERRRVAERLLGETMRRYEDRYHRIFEDNLPLMLFLREIDSPVPGPLRVAADVTLTRRVLDVTGAARTGHVSAERAEGELAQSVALACRLDAHLHLLPVRRDVAELVRSRLEALLSGRAPATRGAELVRILDLSHRLGLELDLWDAQNRLWAWATSAGVTLDRGTTRDLSRALWFDDAVVLERAGFGRDDVQAPTG
ncbi:MAG TPA: glycoside hydrolase, partial [Anaeromyxobacteraceae bacterium]|nr:glycoside hydrolase [Anaeromyxobacteraceae bacterium]